MIYLIMILYHPNRKKFFTIWPVAREGESFIKTVTYDDKGGREGKKLPFGGDVIFKRVIVSTIPV